MGYTDTSPTVERRGKMTCTGTTKSPPVSRVPSFLLDSYGPTPDWSKCDSDREGRELHVRVQVVRTYPSRESFVLRESVLMGFYLFVFVFVALRKQKLNMSDAQHTESGRGGFPDLTVKIPRERDEKNILKETVFSFIIKSRGKGRRWGGDSLRG